MLIWNDELLPICPNMIGGILLYGTSLTENADNIFPSSANLPVAYASNDVNAIPAFSGYLFFNPAIDAVSDEGGGVSPHIIIFNLETVSFHEHLEEEMHQMQR